MSIYNTELYSGSKTANLRVHGKNSRSHCMTVFFWQLLEVSKNRINDHQARMTKVKNTVVDVYITVGR